MAQAVASSSRKSRLLLAVLVTGHLVAITRQVDGGGGVSLLEQGIFTLLSPLQRGLAAVVSALGAAWSGYVDLRREHAENARLKERLRVLEMLLQEKQQLAAEAERLRVLAGIQKRLPLQTLVAEVVARDGQPWFRTLTLAKGSADGVALDAAVISTGGVVGRVIAVGPRAARVQLLIDRDSGAGALVERSRVQGVLEGQVGNAESGTSDLSMRYVSSLADVVAGDVVVTSGLDGIYPKGLVVGRVRSVGPAAGLFKDVVVAPSARFEQLEEVLVVRRESEPLSLTETAR